MIGPDLPVNGDGFSTLKLTEEAVDSLCCPVSLSPYENAQILNCDYHHSLSLSSAQGIYGKIINNQCEIPKPCPLCRVRVTSYQSNPCLQMVVDAILGVNLGPLYASKMREAITKLNLEFKQGVKYPIEKSQFTLGECRIVPVQGAVLELKALNHSQANFNGICNLFLLVEGFRSGQLNSFYYNYSLHIEFNNEKTKDHLSNYIKKNKISSLGDPAYNFGPPKLALRPTQVSKDFLACLNLLVKSNEIDTQADEGLKKFMEFVTESIQNTKETSISTNGF